MPVKQHPIPQNVTQYQFRLIGDMTLKQFLQLAGGAVLAVISFALPIPAFFKWPLIVFFSSLGAALAFLPVEGRPLNQWIIAFFKSIYSPTVYTWQKQPTTDQQPSPKKQKPKPKPKSQPQQTSLPSYQATQKDTPKKKTKTKKAKRRSPQSPPQPQPPHPQKPSPPEASDQPAPPTKPSTPSQQPQQPSQQTPFSSDLPIPHPPEEPNAIVGMTLTPPGKILESTLIEVLKDGSTVRATKANKLGQFRFVKPLDNGTYQITADSDQYQFPTYDLSLEGKILPPLKLQANKKAS